MNINIFKIFIKQRCVNQRYFYKIFIKKVYFVKKNRQNGVLIFKFDKKVNGF